MSKMILHPKRLATFLLFFSMFLSAFASNKTVLAATNPTTPSACDYVGGTCRDFSFFIGGTIYDKLFDFFAIIFSLMALVGIAIGGYQYITAAGNSSQADKGRKTITYTIVGIIIYLASVTVVNLVVRELNRRLG
jgi:Na+/H+ antiporter NhaD/arsenite permease-like protein